MSVEIGGSIPGPVKLDTASPPLRCFFGGMLAKRGDGAATRFSLRHDSNREYNEDLISHYFEVQSADEIVCSCEVVKNYIM